MPLAILTGGLSFGGPLITGGLASSAAPPAADLVAAIRAALSASATVSTAFGDAAATPKFFGDKATGSPALPYLVIGEPMSMREYVAGNNWIERGNVMVSILAVGKLAARTLADKAAVVINDAALIIQGATLMKLRVSNAQFVATDDVAVGVPTAYQIVLTVDYWLTGSL